MNKKLFEIFYLIVILLLTNVFTKSENLEKNLSKEIPARISLEDANKVFPPLNKGPDSSECFLEDVKTLQKRLQNNIKFFEDYFKDVNIINRQHYLKVAVATAHIFRDARIKNINELRKNYATLTALVKGLEGAEVDLQKAVLAHGKQFIEEALKRFYAENQNLTPAQRDYFVEYFYMTMYNTDANEIKSNCIGFKQYADLYPIAVFDTYSLTSSNHSLFDPRANRNKFTNNIIQYQFTSKQVGDIGLSFSFFINNNLLTLKADGNKKIFRFDFGGNRSVFFDTYQKDSIIFNRLTFINMKGQKNQVIFNADEKDLLNCNSDVFVMVSIKKFLQGFKFVVSLRYPLLNKKTQFAFVVEQADFDSEGVNAEFMVQNVYKFCDLEYSHENSIKMFFMHLHRQKLTKKFITTELQCEKEKIQHCKYGVESRCEFCLNLDGTNKYFLFLGKCIEKCPNEHYRNLESPALSSCLPCLDGCVDCTKDSCKKCNIKLGLKLKNGKCVKECENGFYESSTSDSIQCIPCKDPNCQNCTHDKCNKCNPTFFFNKDGKFGNQCNEKCPERFYGDFKDNTCKNCTEGCQSCSDKNSCEQCISPLSFFPEKNICVPNCPAGYTKVSLTTSKHTTCYKCTDKHATKCEENGPEKSVECVEGYVLLKLTKRCEEKAICPNGYFYIEKENICKKCPSECATCEDSNNCNTCKHGFKPIKGVCITNCPSKQTLVEGKCVDCKDRNCETCHQNLSCARCLKPYFLDGKDCVNPCPLGTFPDKESGKCIRCADHCNDCSSKFECKRCEKPWILNKGECVEKCPSNHYNYCDKNNEHCERCDKTCKECTGPTNKDCIICMEGYKKENGQCVPEDKKCKDGQFKHENNCVDCDSRFKYCSSCTENGCQQCKKPYELVNGKCVFRSKDVNLFDGIKLFDYLTTKEKKIVRSEFTYQKDFANFGNYHKSFSIEFNLYLIRLFDRENALEILNITFADTSKLSINIFQDNIIFMFERINGHKYTVTLDKEGTLKKLRKWTFFKCNFIFTVDNNLTLSIQVNSKKATKTHKFENNAAKHNILGFVGALLHLNEETDESVFLLNRFKLLKLDELFTSSSSSIVPFDEYLPLQCDMGCKKCHKGLCKHCSLLAPSEQGVSLCPADKIKVEKDEYVIADKTYNIRDYLDQIASKDPYVTHRYAFGFFIYTRFDVNNFKPFEIMTVHYKNDKDSFIKDFFNITVKSPTSLLINQQLVEIAEIKTNKFYYINISVTKNIITVYTSNLSKKGYIKVTQFENKQIVGHLLIDNIINLKTTSSCQSFSRFSFYYNNIPTEYEVKDESEKKDDKKDCEEYNNLGKCFKCIGDLSLKNGVCVENETAVKFNINKVMNFWDNEERVFNIEENINKDLDKKLTFSFFIIRKAIHAKIEGMKDSEDVDKEESIETDPVSKGTHLFRLFSVSDSNENLHNLIYVRNRQKDSDIEFLCRISKDQYKRVVYRNSDFSDFSYIKIVVSVDTISRVANYFIGDAAKNFQKYILGIKEDKKTYSDSFKNMNFGDKNGKEMNHEIVSIEVSSIYYGEKELKDLTNKTLYPIPCTNYCVLCDYMNQNPKKNCMECYDKTKKNTSNCGLFMHGFKEIISYKENMSQDILTEVSPVVLDSDQYDITNKNNGEKPDSYIKKKVDIYAQTYDYAVTGTILLYEDKIPNDKMELNIFSLSNFREKNTFKFKDNMDINGINFLRMDVIRDQLDSVKCIIRLKHDSSHKIIEFSERFKIKTWVWFQVKVNKKHLSIYMQYANGTNILTKEVELKQRPVALNDNSSLLKNFGRYVKHLNYASIFIMVTPNVTHKGREFLDILQNKYTLVKNYKHWDYVNCQVGCKVCSQLFGKNPNRCLSCEGNKIIKHEKCEDIGYKKISLDKKNYVFEFGYVVRKLEEKIPDFKKEDDLESFTTTFFFRKNFISNRSISSNSFNFFSFSTINFSMKSQGVSDSIYVDMNGVFSDEKLYSIPLKESKSWFKVKLYITTSTVSISIYRLKEDEKLSERLNSFTTTIRNRLLYNYQGDKIIADCNDSLFDISQITLRINQDQKQNPPQTLLPTKNLFSYVYHQTLADSNKNDSEEIKKMYEAFGKLNQENEGILFEESRITLSGTKDCPMDIKVDNSKGSIYPKNRIYSSDNFSFNFNMKLSLGNSKFDQYLSIVKINNNAKSENRKGNNDYSLTNIVEIKMKDEFTLLVYLGDKESYLKNNNQILPIEYKFKNSLLDKYVKFFISKTHTKFQIFIYRGRNSYFELNQTIQEYNFSRLTNEGHVYLFDNPDSINKNIKADLLDVEFDQNSSEFKLEEILEYADGVRYSFQDSCNETPNDYGCNQCRSGTFLKNEYCLNYDNSQVVVNRNPKWLTYSSNDGESSNINLPKISKIDGFTISFHIRRYIIESEAIIPVIRLTNQNQKYILLTINMDFKKLHIKNHIAKKYYQVNLPGDISVHNLREYFVSVSVNLKNKHDTVVINAYNQVMELNNTEENESSTIDYYSNKKDLSFSPQNMKINFAQDHKYIKGTSVRTDFYIHSVVFDPVAGSKVLNRVRYANICDKPCKVSCEKTNGICPIESLVDPDHNLSVTNLSSSNVDIKTIFSLYPMFRKINFTDKSLQAHEVNNNYLLRFDVFVNLLNAYNDKNNVNKDVLFALNTRMLAEHSSLKMNDLVPQSAIDSSFLNMKIELCQDPKNKNCRKHLKLGHGYFEKLGGHSDVIELDNNKNLVKLSITILVKSNYGTRENNEKKNVVQTSEITILVRENNLIHVKKIEDAKLNAALTFNTFVYNHPMVSNFKINMADPNLEKSVWYFKTQNTNFEKEKLSDLCSHLSGQTECLICLKNYCLTCSENSYNNMGRCALKNE
jgi:hypothetical protein